MGVGQEAGPQKDRMLPIFRAQRIDTLIEIGQPLQPDDVAKEIELAVIRVRRVREARLLSPPPLRTGRESFPSSGSSLE